jgi:hypothetical protein
MLRAWCVASWLVSSAGIQYESKALSRGVSGCLINLSGSYFYVSAMMHAKVRGSVRCCLKLMTLVD